MEFSGSLTIRPNCYLRRSQSCHFPRREKHRHQLNTAPARRDDAPCLGLDVIPTRISSELPPDHRPTPPSRDNQGSVGLCQILQDLEFRRWGTD